MGLGTERLAGLEPTPSDVDSPELKCGASNSTGRCLLLMSELEENLVSRYGSAGPIHFKLDQCRSA